MKRCWQGLLRTRHACTHVSLLRRLLRKLFPPVVSGVTIALIGISLTGAGIQVRVAVLA